MRLSALCAIVLAATAPAQDLEREISVLEERVARLEARRARELESRVEEYLASTEAWRGAQAGPALEGLTVTAALTGVFQGTLGLDQGDRHAVSGDYDLDFDYEITPGLRSYVHLTGNTDVFGRGGSATASPGLPISGSGFPRLFDSPLQRTFSGMTDGIGVDGTQPTAPGSVEIYEAGVVSLFYIGELKLFLEVGAIDPRRRFLANAVADDENTQFINNLFDDSPSILWLTDASGRTALGVMAWVELGQNEDFRLTAGWFNVPGRWFDGGQLYLEAAWRGEVGGRDMNARLLLFLDSYFVDEEGQGSLGWGFSWDWWMAERLGLFARFATNYDDVNPIGLDWSLGWQWCGLIGDRDEDALGFAFGLIQANLSATGPPYFHDASGFKSREWTFEIYWKFLLEGGRLQVTPHFMVVLNPGGVGAGWTDSTLFLLGLRLHVPF